MLMTGNVLAFVAMDVTRRDHNYPDHGRARPCPSRTEKASETVGFKQPKETHANTTL